MGEATNVTTPGICKCLQGAGDSRKRTGEAYWILTPGLSREDLVPCEHLHSVKINGLAGSLFHRRCSTIFHDCIAIQYLQSAS